MGDPVQFSPLFHEAKGFEQGSPTFQVSALATGLWVYRVAVGETLSISPVEAHPLCITNEILIGQE